MSDVRRFDHVGITVADLDRATAFFVGLGLEIEGRMSLQGEFVDTVIGIPDSLSEIVMLRPPDGGAGLELSSFLRPDHEPGSPAAMSTELENSIRRSRNSESSLTFQDRSWRRGSIRERLAHGLRARTGRNHRVPGRADRLMPPAASQTARSCGRKPVAPHSVKSARRTPRMPTLPGAAAAASGKGSACDEVATRPLGLRPVDAANRVVDPPGFVLNVQRMVSPLTASGGAGWSSPR